MDRRTLERRLEDVRGFADPDVAREQYRTDPAVAAHLLHRAAMAGDLAGRTVVDLGAGTGMLAVGAALLGARRVVALEVDPPAVAVGRENAARLLNGGATRGGGPAADATVEWVLADAAALPLSLGGVTVLANPPFGAQDGHAGADRPFLDAAAAIAAVSYTVHNAGSRDFVEAYAGERGGAIEAAFALRLDVARQFDFHDAKTETVPAEAYRIEWA
ncbi:MAG: METTL5 family protein [Halobacteriaceae archaeon]